MSLHTRLISISQLHFYLFFCVIGTTLLSALVFRKTTPMQTQFDGLDPEDIHHKNPYAALLAQGFDDSDIPLFTTFATLDCCRDFQEIFYNWRQAVFADRYGRTDIHHHPIGPTAGTESDADVSNLTSKLIRGGTRVSVEGLYNGNRFLVEFNIRKSGKPYGVDNLRHDLYHSAMTGTAGDMSLNGRVGSFRTKLTPDYCDAREGYIMVADTYTSDQLVSSIDKDREKLIRYQQMMIDAQVHHIAEFGQNLGFSFFTMGVVMNTFFLPFLVQDTTALGNIHHLVTKILNESLEYLQIAESMSADKLDLNARYIADSRAALAALPEDNYYGGITKKHLSKWEKIVTTGRHLLRPAEIFKKCIRWAIGKVQVFSDTDESRIENNEKAFKEKRVDWSELTYTQQPATIVNIPLAIPVKTCLRTAPEDKKRFCEIYQQLADIGFTKRMDDEGVLTRLLACALKADFPAYEPLNEVSEWDLSTLYQACREEIKEEQERLAQLAEDRPDAYAQAIERKRKSEERFNKSSPAYNKPEDSKNEEFTRIHHSIVSYPNDEFDLLYMRDKGFAGTKIPFAQDSSGKPSKEIYDYQELNLELLMNFLNNQNFLNPNNAETILPNSAFELLRNGCTDKSAEECVTWTREILRTDAGQALQFWSKFGFKLSHYARTLPGPKKGTAFQVCPGVMCLSKSRGMKREHRKELGSSCILFFDRAYWTTMTNSPWLETFQIGQMLATKPFFVRNDTMVQLARSKLLVPMLTSMMEVSRVSLLPGRSFSDIEVPKTVRNHFYMAMIFQTANKTSACQAAQLFRYMMMQICTKPLELQSTVGNYLKKMPKPFNILTGAVEKLCLDWGLSYTARDSWPKQTRNNFEDDVRQYQLADDFEGLYDIFNNPVRSIQEVLTFHSLSCLCSDIGSKNPNELFGKIAALESVKPDEERIGLEEIDEVEDAHEFDPAFIIGLARSVLNSAEDSARMSKAKAKILDESLSLIQYKVRLKTLNYLASSVRKLCTMKASTHWNGFFQAFNASGLIYENVNQQIDELLKNSVSSKLAQGSTRFIGARKKLLEVIMGRVEELADPNDPYPMLSLVEKAMEVVVAARGILVTLFAKPQLGAREISIADEWARILQSVTESIFNSYLKFINEDAMAKGDSKHFRMMNFLESVGKDESAGYEVVYMFDSVDCTKWCQQFMMSIFGCLIYGLEAEPNGIVMTALNSFARKMILLDDDQYSSMVELGKAKDIILPPEEREVLDEFLGRKIGSLFKGVKNPRVMHVTSGMMQGWVHSGSSVINAAFLNYASSFFRKTAVNYLNSQSMSRSDRIRRLETLGKINAESNAQQIEKAVQNDLLSYPFKLKCSFSSSSDDVGLMWALINYNKEAQSQRQKMTWFLKMCSTAMEKAYGYASIRISKEKSARFGTHLLYEFLSIFFCGSKMFTAQLKFINGATSLKNENVIRKFQTVDYSAAMDMCANGIDSLSATIMLCVQSLWSYEMLGAGTVTNWSNFSSLYDRNPNILGGFRIIAGPTGIQLGESFAIWAYEKGGPNGNVRWSNEARVLSQYLYGGQDGSAEKMSLAFIPPREGVYKDFLERSEEAGWLKKNFRDELNKPENWKHLFQSPIEPIGLKLMASKTLISPQMEEALNSSEKIEAMLRGSYCLFSRVFKVKACLPRTSEMRAVRLVTGGSYQTKYRLTLTGFLTASKTEVHAKMSLWAVEARKLEFDTNYVIELAARFVFLDLYETVFANLAEFERSGIVRVLPHEKPSFLSVVTLENFKIAEMSLKDLVAFHLKFIIKSSRVVNQSIAYYSGVFQADPELFRSVSGIMKVLRVDDMVGLADLLEQLQQPKLEIRGFCTTVILDPILAFQHVLRRAYGRMTESSYGDVFVRGLESGVSSATFAAIMEAPFPVQEMREEAIRLQLEKLVIPQLENLSVTELSLFLSRQMPDQREICIFALILRAMYGTRPDQKAMKVQTFNLDVSQTSKSQFGQLTLTESALGTRKKSGNDSDDAKELDPNAFSVADFFQTSELDPAITDWGQYRTDDELTYKEINFDRHYENEDEKEDDQMTVLAKANRDALLSAGMSAADVAEFLFPIVQFGRREFTDYLNETYFVAETSLKAAARWRESVKRWGRNDIILVPVSSVKMDARVYLSNGVEICFELFTRETIKVIRGAARSMFLIHSVTCSSQLQIAVSTGWKLLMEKARIEKNFTIDPPYKTADDYAADYANRDELMSPFKRGDGRYYNFSRQGANTLYGLVTGQISRNPIAGSIRIDSDSSLLRKDPPSVNASVHSSRKDRSLCLVMRRDKYYVDPDTRQRFTVEPFIIYKSKIGMQTNMSNNIAADFSEILELGPSDTMKYNINKVMMNWMASRPLTCSESLDMILGLFTLYSNFNRNDPDEFWPDPREPYPGFMRKPCQISKWQESISKSIEDLGKNYKRAIMKSIRILTAAESSSVKASEQVEAKVEEKLSVDYKLEDYLHTDEFEHLEIPVSDNEDNLGMFLDVVDESQNLRAEEIAAEDADSAEKKSNSGASAPNSDGNKFVGYDDEEIPLEALFANVLNDEILSVADFDSSQITIDRPPKMPIHEAASRTEWKLSIFIVELLKLKPLKVSSGGAIEIWIEEDVFKSFYIDHDEWYGEARQFVWFATTIGIKLVTAKIYMQALTRGQSREQQEDPNVSMKKRKTGLKM